MTSSNAPAGSTAAAPAPAGFDAVLPFAVEPLDVRGRSVQLGPLLDAILDRHDYPAPVSRLLAEAITLTVLLGSSLKFDGKFIVQTKTDGAVPLIVTEYKTPGDVRAYASFDTDAVAALEEAGTTAVPDLLGEGILAMTIDQGKYTNRYQGIVKLDGIDLEEVARQYFRQSEQIPTEVRLAVGETLTRSEDGSPLHGWTASGMLVQFLPESEERARLQDLPGGDGAEEDDFDADEAWTETLALMSTIEASELIDPDVSAERLLFRLFNEHGVRVFAPIELRDACGCSEDKVRGVLAGFTDEQLADSIEDGAITVTCEFCSTRYEFSPAEIATLQ